MTVYCDEGLNAQLAISFNPPRVSWSAWRIWYRLTIYSTGTPPTVNEPTFVTPVSRRSLPFSMPSTNPFHPPSQRLGDPDEPSPGLRDQQPASLLGGEYRESIPNHQDADPGWLVEYPDNVCIQLASPAHINTIVGPEEYATIRAPGCTSQYRSPASYLWKFRRRVWRDPTWFKGLRQMLEIR